MKVIVKVATESKHRKWTTETIVRQNTGGEDDSGCGSSLLVVISIQQSVPETTKYNITTLDNPTVG
jgi:hypothetical protein